MDNFIYYVVVGCLPAGESNQSIQARKVRRRYFFTFRQCFLAVWADLAFDLAGRLASMKVVN